MSLKKRAEEISAKYSADPAALAYRIAEIESNQIQNRAMIQRLQLELHEAYDVIAAEKQKRLPPAEQLADVRREQEEFNKKEDEFNRRVDEFEAQGRRSRRHRMDDQAAALRAAAIRELKALIPMAKKQARAGKPALLRLILRSAR